MGKVTIQNYTTENPISMIGKEAGICWGADTSDDKKNYNRGLSCIKSGHGRTMEYPDIYMILDGYSARVIREFYTHIGGSPTRLQASTRYIQYGEFDYIIPYSIANNKETLELYEQCMNKISYTYYQLEKVNIPKEDIANILPLGMTTKVVVKINSRTISDMSKQRKCMRAYWEFREMFRDIENALNEYSNEWKIFTEMNFKAKCEDCGYCIEEKSCGRYPKKS